MELLLIYREDLRKDCRLMEFNGIVIDISGGFLGRNRSMGFNGIVINIFRMI